MKFFNLKLGIQTFRVTQSLLCRPPVTQVSSVQRIFIQSSSVQSLWASAHSKRFLLLTSDKNGFLNDGRRRYPLFFSSFCITNSLTPKCWKGPEASSSQHIRRASGDAVMKSSILSTSSWESVGSRPGAFFGSKYGTLSVVLTCLLVTSSWSAILFGSFHSREAF